MAVFDRIADEYDQWYETKLGKFADEVETKLAFSLFQPKPGMHVLDAGCGTGNFSIKLAQAGCRVTGIDISEEMLKIAKQKAQKMNLDIDFRVMDIYHLQFEDETFDAVFSMAAFEFIEKPQEAYQEMYRVLKRNGQLLIGTIHKESHWGRLYLSEAFQKESVFRHARFKTLEELKNLDLEHLVDSRECLFIPPDIPEEEIHWEKEKEFSTRERGGYICALWKKTE